MTYHRSPLSGHGPPPWGPEGGAWWRYDRGWTPNIQGPWNAGYPGVTPWSGGELVMTTVPSQSDLMIRQQAQQALQLSRQAIEAAASPPRPLWERALNWVKENPMWAGGIVVVAALAAQQRGLISNGRAANPKRPVLHVESCVGCGADVSRRVDRPFEGEVLCASCKRKGRRGQSKQGGWEAAVARGRAAVVVRTCGDCGGSGLTSAGRPCFCPAGDAHR